MSTILILGATSDIAKAIAEQYAKAGNSLILAVRKKDHITDFAGHLRIKYENSNSIIELDILNVNTHQEVYNTIPAKPDGVVCAVGYLGSQENAQQDAAEAQRIINTNFTALAGFIEIAVADFIARKTGFVVAISSVAGDRGRQSNYFYGAAKAGFSAYLSGLRQRLYKHNIPVLNVKPGFVKTKMTDHLSLPPLLTASPESLAKAIFKAQQKQKSTLYSSGLWRGIMLIIIIIPEAIFKRLRL
jgi:decaprenylphospho-beta-D-erythro-pentofuranosid-2-ulose 2-reductase